MEAPMNIDLQTLVANSLMILTPFVTSSVAKAEETVVEKIADETIKQGQSLFKMIFSQFKKVDDGGKAIKVLENFREDPEEYESNLQRKLIDVLQTDHDFVAELQQFFEQGAVQEILVRGGSSARGNVMANSTNKGTQRMVAVDNSHLENNQMHLG